MIYNGNLGTEEFSSSLALLHSDSDIKTRMPKEAISFVKFYLSSEKLHNDTVEFSSNRLANTNVREDLLSALSLYEEFDFSWWTPDDMFFVRYTSRNVANYVFELFSL